MKKFLRRCRSIPLTAADSAADIHSVADESGNYLLSIIAIPEDAFAATRLLLALATSNRVQSESMYQSSLASLSIFSINGRFGKASPLSSARSQREISDRCRDFPGSSTHMREAYKSNGGERLLRGEGGSPKLQQASGS